MFRVLRVYVTVKWLHEEKGGQEGQGVWSRHFRPPSLLTESRVYVVPRLRHEVLGDGLDPSVEGVCPEDGGNGRAYSAGRR